MSAVLPVHSGSDADVLSYPAARLDESRGGGRLSYEDMARSHVKELAREAFGLQEVMVDADGDLPFPVGTAMVYVSVEHAGRTVRAWSRSVYGIEPKKSVLRELDEANAQATLARLYTRGDCVVVEAVLPTTTLRPGDLGRLVAEVGCTSDRVGSMLAAVHGGWVAIPEGCDTSVED